MTEFPPDLDEMAIKLGIGPLTRQEPCHGYANACVCSRCLEREERHEAYKEALLERLERLALLERRYGITFRMPE